MRLFQGSDSRATDHCGSSTTWHRVAAFTIAAAILLVRPTSSHAQAFVPGTGQRLAQVGDDFEDPKWNYIPNEPKSSEENDKQERLPAGRAANGRSAPAAAANGTNRPAAPTARSATSHSGLSPASSPTVVSGYTAPHAAPIVTSRNRPRRVTR